MSIIGLSWPAATNLATSCMQRPSGAQKTGWILGPKPVMLQNSLQVFSFHQISLAACMAAHYACAATYPIVNQPPTQEHMMYCDDANVAAGKQNKPLNPTTHMSLCLVLLLSGDCEYEACGHSQQRLQTSPPARITRSSW